MDDITLRTSTSNTEKLQHNEEPKKTNNTGTIKPQAELKENQKTSDTTPKESKVKESKLKLFKKNFINTIKSAFNIDTKSTSKNEGTKELKSNVAQEFNKGAKAAINAGKALGVLSAVVITISFLVPGFVFVSAGLLALLNKKVTAKLENSKKLDQETSQNSVKQENSNIKKSSNTETPKKTEEKEKTETEKTVTEQNINPQISTNTDKKTLGISDIMTDEKGKITKESIDEFTKLAKNFPEEFSTNIASLALDNPEITGKLLYSLPILDKDIFSRLANKLDTQTHADVIKSTITFAIQGSKDKGTLLRKNDNSSMILKSFIQKNLDPLFNNILEKQINNKTIPEIKIKEKNEFIKEEIVNSKQVTVNVLNGLNDLIEKNDPKLKIYKKLCRDLCEVGQKQYDTGGKETILANLLFLRAFNPAITALKGINAGDLQKQYAIHLSKVIQNLANNVEMGGKEKHLAPLKDWGSENGEGKQLLNKIYENLLK